MFNYQSMASTSLTGAFAGRISIRKPSGSSLPLEPHSLRTILRPLPRPALGWAVGTTGPTDHRQGNTRFLKCVFQCLAHVPGVTETCASAQHRSFCHGRIRWLASGGRAPMGFFCMRCTLDSQVAEERRAFDERQASQGCSQSPHISDSQDFAAFGRRTCQGAFIGMLEEAADMERMMAPGSRRNLVDECFNGICQSTTTCRKCNGSLYDTASPFKMMALYVPETASPISVQRLLEQSIGEQLVTGPHECPHCHSEVELTHQLAVTRPPEVLVLQLNRFTRRGRRVRAAVQVDTELNLAPCIAADKGDCSGSSSSSSSGSSQYALSAVITHCGEDPSAGEYGAYVRTAAGGWYSLSAMGPYRVRVREEAVQRLDAFMLFYSRDGAVQPSVMEDMAMAMAMAPAEAGRRQRGQSGSSRQELPAGAEDVAGGGQPLPYMYQERYVPTLHVQHQPPQPGPLRHQQGQREEQQALQQQPPLQQQQQARNWSFPVTLIPHQLLSQLMQAPGSIAGRKKVVAVSPEPEPEPCVKTPALVEDPLPPHHREDLQRMSDPEEGWEPAPSQPVPQFNQTPNGQQPPPLVALLEIPRMPNLHSPHASPPRGSSLAPMTPPPLQQPPPPVQQQQQEQQEQQQEQGNLGETPAPLTPPLPVAFLVVEPSPEAQAGAAAAGQSGRAGRTQEAAAGEADQEKGGEAAALGGSTVSAWEAEPPAAERLFPAIWSGAEDPPRSQILLPESDACVWERRGAARDMETDSSAKLPRKRKLEEKGVSRLSRTSTSRTSTTTTTSNNRADTAAEKEEEEEAAEEQEGESSDDCFWSAIFRRLKRARVKLESITAEMDAVEERVEIRKARTREFWAAWDLKLKGQQQ